MSSLPNINCYDIGWEFGGELLVLGMGHGASVIESALRMRDARRRHRAPLRFARWMDPELGSHIARHRAGEARHSTNAQSLYLLRE